MIKFKHICLQNKLRGVRCFQVPVLYRWWKLVVYMIELVFAKHGALHEGQTFKPRFHHTKGLLWSDQT